MTRDPAALLARLDPALTDELYDSDRFVTVGCASCALTAGGLDVRLSLAGNPPPLLTGPTAAAQSSAAPGPVVGVACGASPRSV